MVVEVSFGEWLKRQRSSRGLTQEQLAHQIGCAVVTLRKIEAEERRPSAQMVERMAEILKIPPDERTSFLRYARGDLRYTPTERMGEAPWHISTVVSRSNLPAPPSSLIGRGQEIALVREYLSKDDIRLVTLIGPPGIGKTRLSVESARQLLANFSHGVFFVTLAPLDDPALIPSAIVQALGYVEMKDQPAVEQLKDGIGDKQMLIVLDNCEHLIEGTATLVSDLLSACSHLRILATSRESLRLPGEWLYLVPALAIPKESSSMNIESVSEFPALTLFAERARAVRSDFVLSVGNLREVVSICTQVDGLPLAIELIAARMRLMSPQALLERMTDQFILSADGMRANSARQKTLNDAIGWSYHLLSVEEQKLFASLSVFSGGFMLEAAEAIFPRTAAERPVADLVTLLLDKSLIQRVLDESDEPRFTMLVTIQEFARTRLREMGEETEVRNGHLTYFLALAEKGDAEIRGPNQVEWLNRLNAMRDNLRAASDWAIETGQTETALQMARKLHWFFFVRGDHTEGRQWLRRVLALPEAAEYPGLHAQALTQIAHHTWLQIGSMEAKPFIDQALHIARAHNDKWNTARALMILGLVMNREHNFDEAQDILEKSKALFQEVHDDWGYGHTLMGLGQRAFLMGDGAKILTLHNQALVQFRQLGDRYFQSVALRYISYEHVKQGNWLIAQNALRESLVLALELGSTWEVAAVLWGFTDAIQGAGDYAGAIRLNWAAKNIFESVGAWKQEDEPVFQEVLESCRAALSEVEFEEAVEEGRAMTLEQAIQYALEKSDG
jgi:predicted ATPase/transcriptional regulator with XRE-family HTH domain